MMVEAQIQQVTDNLYITNNEVEILDSLVDSKNMFYDFSKNKVVSFIKEMDFNLILYNSSERDRGFTMYVVKNFCEHEEELVLLRNVFNNIIGAGVNQYMMRIAKSKVEDIFYMANTFRALFKKPKSDEDYDVMLPSLPSSFTY